MKRNKVILICSAAAMMLLWTVIHVIPPSPHPSGPLPHECYIWQRNWNDDLLSSISQAEGTFRGFTVLAAEIDVRPGRQTHQIMPADYAFLSTVPVPVGIAIRINPYSGPFDETTLATQRICRVIKTVLQACTDAGFEPAEIQLDYDCAESKLTGYRTWIEHFKEVFQDYPITITALPSWMNNHQFKELVRSCDGYILQVHSLQRPRTVADEVVLCDPGSTLKWVKRAERFDVPYRLALPTYGYLVAYDEQGAFFGLSAEGPMPGWPADTKIKTVLSDPEKIASIIQDIGTVSPKHLTGIIWFRLPVASDQLNWQWHTLKRMVRRQPLTEKIEAVYEWPEPHLAEITLVNSGDIDVSVPMTVSLTFHEANCLAADGLKGYVVHEVEEDGTLLLCPDNVDSGWRIRSQEKITIAWCRFDSETEVKTSVQSDSQ